MSSDPAAAATSANNHHQHQNHRNSNRNATASASNANTNNNARLQPAINTTATSTTPSLLDAPLDPNDEDAHIRQGLDVIQSMVDASANRLEGLRHHCSTHVELTQHEIRMLESKLVRMFTEMLAIKAKLPERLPSGLPPATEAELRQWMRIVGLSAETQLAMLPRCDSVETLLQLNDAELRGLLQPSPHPRKEEEARRLVCAMAHLRHCRQLLRTGAGGYKEGAFTSASMPSDMFWDSWDRHHHHGHHGHHREHRERGGSGGGSSGAASSLAGSGGISPRLLRQHPGGGLAPKPKPLSRTMASSVQSLHATSGGSPQHMHQQPASLPAQQQQQQQQFSPPSADAAAAALAATLNQQRRRTLTPEETGGGLLRTPSPSPPSSPSTNTTTSSATTANTMYIKNSVVRSVGGAFTATPPLKRHLQTPEQTPQHHQQQQSSLTKSKSHESQLLLGPGGATLSTVGGDAATHAAEGDGGTSGHPIRSRLHTEPSPDNHQYHHQPAHNIESGHQASPGHQHQHPQYLHSSQLAHHNDHLQVPPRSPVIAIGQQQQQQLQHQHPRSANIMQTSTGSSVGGGDGDSPLHGHYFNKKFKVMSNCDLCNKSMFYGFKCKECKYRCHKDCEPLVTAICPASVLRKSQAMQQADVALMGSHSPTLNRTGGGFGAATAALLSAGGGMNSLRGGAGVRRDRLRSTDFGNMGGGGGLGGVGGGGMESGGSAGSSCNSSTPSSPALLTLSAMHSGGSQSTSNPMSTSVVSASSSSTTSSTFAAGGGGGGGVGVGGVGGHSTQPPAVKTQFKFPDIYKPDTVGSITLEKHFSKQEEQRQQQQQHSAAAVPASPRSSKTAVKSPPDVVVSAESAASAAARATSLAAAAAADAAAVANGGADESGQTAAANHLQVPRRQMQIPTVTVKDVLTSSAVDTASATSGANSEATTTTTSSTSTSNDSDRTAIRLDSADDPDEADDRIEADGHWSRQNSVSLKEWDIPIEDIVLMEKIGDGRFGTVHRAQWHGAVAIKILKEDYLDNEAFKVEVATFKKTRHENVVLFMGACIRPQAIVTSLCKGNTLYTHIHVRKDRFNLNKTTMVAQQISLGMGYLHARNITHKDLKTKNIFLENGKVIITDFGLFSATKLEYDERLGLRVPYGWLAYLAPEIMQQLQPRPPEHRDALPFSSKSDIYAFGTVWYELLCGELPFRAQAPEAIIFQVGRGMKQSLANLQAARDVKEILMTCWSFDYNLRPDFSAILQQLEKLPKKRLARSPSHPVQLSRSAESVF